jgi:hypothetical protein
MSFFIFLKNTDNVEGVLFKIAENQFELDNLNIDKNSYTIIEDSQFNFDLVKYHNKSVIKYNNNIITYVDSQFVFEDQIIINSKTNEQIVTYTAKQFLKDYIEKVKNQIKQFLNNNNHHVLFSKWDNYYNQLDSLNLDTITYPLNKSLEQYFKDENKPSLNPLQIP